ncbi:MAG: Lipopolysaccharide export system permease LptF/LptG [Planctomycetota bacterium]|jgi:lipopolysaccharide export LptBFGC system permease protein LptF
MWKLHRYYLRELGINSGITFLVLFAIVLVSLVARGIQRSQGGGLLDAALITVFWALDSFPHLLAIAFMIATVLTFVRAVQDRELTAIRAAGIAPRVPMTSALLLGIALSVLGSVAMHYVIPEVHFRKYRVIADVVRSAVLNLRLDSDRIKILDTGFVMTFRRREGADYVDCTIYCPPDRTLGGMRSPILRVERVSIPPFDERTDDLRILPQGIRDPIGEVRTESLPLAIPVSDIADQNRRDERDDDLRSDQLISEVLRGVHPDPVGAMYTLFRRMNFAMLPAVLAPIAYCIAEFAQARGRILALVLSLVPLALFYLGEVFGVRLVIATRNPWCAWLPLLMIALVGGPLVWRQLRR